jgi:hypothetical protein
VLLQCFAEKCPALNFPGRVGDRIAQEGISVVLRIGSRSGWLRRFR